MAECTVELVGCVGQLTRSRPELIPAEQRDLLQRVKDRLRKNPRAITGAWRSAGPRLLAQWGQDFEICMMQIIEATDGLDAVVTEPHNIRNPLGILLQLDRLETAWSARYWWTARNSRTAVWEEDDPTRTAFDEAVRQCFAPGANGRRDCAALDALWASVAWGPALPESLVQTGAKFEWTWFF